MPEYCSVFQMPPGAVPKGGAFGSSTAPAGCTAAGTAHGLTSLAHSVFWFWFYIVLREEWLFVLSAREMCELEKPGPKLPEASLIAIAIRYFLMRNVIDTARI